jgi:hypothetical protein
VLLFASVFSGSGGARLEVTSVDAPIQRPEMFFGSMSIINTSSPLFLIAKTISLKPKLYYESSSGKHYHESMKRLIISKIIRQVCVEAGGGKLRRNRRSS